MKTFLAITALLAISLTSPSRAQTADKLNPGDALPAPNVSLQNATGLSTTLKEASKKNGLLVMFSCNTCPFVIKNQPITKKAIAYAAAHEVGMVIINSNEAKRGDDDSYLAMKKYAKEQGYTVPYLVDENSMFADLFGASHTPEVYLFDKDGKLVYKGAMNDNPGNPNEYKKMYVEEAMSAMIAGKPVDPKTTKSIGCGIKRKA